MKMAVHNGVFHADDVFCVALIQLIDEKVEVIRTRDQTILESCEIVADVGEGRYDHHQAEKILRPDGIPYSAFGLLWRDFGLNLVKQMSKNLLTIEQQKEVVQQVAIEFITQIDASDNGIHLNHYDSPITTLSQVISSFIPSKEENKDMDTGFFEAVNLAKHLLKKVVSKTIATYTNLNEVKKELTTQDIADTHILILKGDIRWKEALLTLDTEEKVWFVVFEDTTGSWRVQTVPKEVGSFESRYDLPVSWGGQREEELSVLTGIEGCVFCHPNLFICGNKTKVGALQMAKQAVANILLT